MPGNQVVDEKWSPIFRAGSIGPVPAAGGLALQGESLHIRGNAGGPTLGRSLKSPPPPADLCDMKTFTNLLSLLARDERGGEVLEYALVAGLLVVSAIAVIGSVGTKVLARWRSLDNSL